MYDKKHTQFFIVCNVCAVNASELSHLRSLYNKTFKDREDFFKTIVSIGIIHLKLNIQCDGKAHTDEVQESPTL